MRVETRARLAIVGLAAVVLAWPAWPSAAGATLTREPWPPAVVQEDQGAPELSAEDSLKTIVVPPGYRVELVAKEPLVEDPILIDFDADGRMWVVEMPAFAMGEEMRDSREGICRVVVLEDLDDDGTMDRRTVFADKLVLPRAIKTLATGVLVGEPPHLWWMRDTNGDLKMDEKELVSDTFGRLEGNPEHNANSLIWGLDNWVYTSEHDWHLRFRGGGFEVMPTLNRGQWGGSIDDAGRVYRNVNSSPLFVDFTPARYFMRNPNVVQTRGLYESLISLQEAEVWPVRPTRGVNRGYRDQFFRPDGSSRILQSVGHARRLPRRSPARGAAGRRVRHRRHDEHAALVRDRRRRPRPPDRPQRLRGRGDLRLPRRAPAAGERRLRARRHPLRRGHVPRRGAGRGVPDRLPAGLHPAQPARPARQPRTHLAPRPRDDPARPQARAVEGDAGGARRRIWPIRTAGGGTPPSSSWCSAATVRWFPR